jgi:hypothetical protein
MNVQELREPYAAAPFQPFEIVLTNGARVPVDHPEFMSFSQDYRTVHVHDRDGTTRRLDIKLITKLSEPKNGAGPRKRKR